MKSIRFKLWAGMMALVALILVLIWLYQIVFLGNYYNKLWMSNIKRELINITTILEAENHEDFEGKLQSFAYNNDLFVEFVDSNGNARFAAGSSGPAGKMPMIDHEAKEEFIEEVLNGNELDMPVTHPSFGAEYVLIGLPVKISGEVTNAMLIIASLAPLEETTNILKGQHIYITIVLLISSLMISFPISLSFTNPILEIKNVAEKMAAGDFAARINLKKKPKKRDEIGILAETVNNMGEQLSKIDKLRKDVIANVSHDLRTPLSLIRGYAETIKDVTGDHPEKRERQLNVIIEESERLGKIVDDILNLSQLQSGNVTLDKKVIQLEDLLETAVNSYGILSEKTGVTIERAGSTDAMIEGDEVRLGQVIHNLISNAFNHTPHGGKITVKTLDGPSTVRVEIADTGNGISEEILPHIWDRYYKADKTTGRKSTGSGIGLAIVKGNLEAHQAKFGVESKKQVGTTFWFELKRING